MINEKQLKNVMRREKIEDMFKKIVIVEPVFITNNGKDKLQNLCEKFNDYDTNVLNEKETIERIGDADCILVSANTIINQAIIENCPNLKHVALCCSFYGKEFAKVDIDALERRGVTYSYLSEYGDNGTVEYVVAQTINLIHGFYGKRLKDEVYDLRGIKIGILGLGNLGTKIARVFRLLNANVYYYSKTRKKKIESELNIQYLELNELLSMVDVISINLNRDVCLIGGDNLKKYGNGKAIINTSIGKCYELESLKEWLQNKSNYYICDNLTINDDVVEILNWDNVIFTNVDSGGSTKQCLEEATEQIINNIKTAYQNCKKR